MQRSAVGFRPRHLLEETPRFLPWGNALKVSALNAPVQSMGLLEHDQAQRTLEQLIQNGVPLEYALEGVETEAQLNFLKTHRCDQVQGFYIAKPMPPEDCIKILGWF